MRKVYSAFKGADGNLSIRKVMSIIFSACGIILLTIGMFTQKQVLPMLAPGAICLLFSAVLLGLVTVQNIKDIMHDRRQTRR